MSPDDPRHGTVAGYGQHHKTGTLPACDACKRAVAKYQANRELMKMRGQSHTVAARGTIRRIQALVALGWPMPLLSQRLGAAQPQTIQNLARKPHDARIRVATAAKISALYEELSMTIGPSTVSAARARNKGWLPPLAWDDIDNDREPASRKRPCSAPGCARRVVARGVCNTHYNEFRRAA